MQIRLQWVYNCTAICKRASVLQHNEDLYYARYLANALRFYSGIVCTWRLCRSLLYAGTMNVSPLPDMVHKHLDHF